MAKKYGPTDKAKRSPRYTWLPSKKKFVGVGGDVKVVREAPKKGETYKEATSKEYEELKHMITLVQEIQDTSA